MIDAVTLQPFKTRRSGLVHARRRPPWHSPLGKHLISTTPSQGWFTTAVYPYLDEFRLFEMGGCNNLVSKGG